MKRKKLIIAAVVMLLVFLVGGAIAFFTDEEEVTNTFTIGKVDITLTEPNWVAEDAKNMMPGSTVAKDPTITVAADSADAYVFAKVEIPCVGTTPRELFTYTVDSAWTVLDNGSCTGGKATKIYGHTQAMSANATSTIFSSVKLDENLTQTEAESLNSIEMPIKAYAIQKDNVAGATLDVFNANFNN